MAGGFYAPPVKITERLEQIAADEQAAKAALIGSWRDTSDWPADRVEAVLATTAWWEQIERTARRRVRRARMQAWAASRTGRWGFVVDAMLEIPGWVPGWLLPVFKRAAVTRWRRQHVPAVVRVAEAVAPLTVVEGGRERRVASRAVIVKG